MTFDLAIRGDTLVEGTSWLGVWKIGHSPVGSAVVPSGEDGGC